MSHAPSDSETESHPLVTQHTQHVSDFEGFEYSRINEDIIRSMTTFTWKYWLALGISGALVLIGAAVYYYQTTQGLGVWGTNEPIYWGLDIPSFIFWIGFSLSGTLLSAILLLTKSHWRNPIYRAAEASTGFALITAQVVVLTHLGRPWRSFYGAPYPNMRFLWTNFRSPLTADIMGMIAYLTASMLFLIVGAIPDFAVLRDHTTGWRKKLYTVLSFGWKGSDQQWRHFRRAYVMIACFIIPIAVAMHSVTSWVPSMTINPGSHSTIYPMYFVVGALLSGVAGVILIAILVRRFLHLEEYIKVKYLDHLAKLLLLASMLISYIYLIEVFVPWYKPTNFEFMPVVAKLIGKYAPIFWTMVLLNSVIPLTLFMRRVRRSVPALFLISVGVQVAMYFERYLMVIPSLSLGPLPATWISYRPTWVELVLLVWGLSIFTFLYIGFVKIVPVVSIFEVKELLKIPKRSEKLPAAEPLEKRALEELVPAGAAFGGGLATSVATATVTTNGYKPLLGLFPFVDDTVQAIERLREAGFRRIEVQSPVPCHEIDEAMDKDASRPAFSPKAVLQMLRNRNMRVVRFSAIGAVGAAGFAMLLAGGTAVMYPIQGGGLPILALPAIAFTTGIFTALGGLVVSVVGLFFLARLPALKLRLYDASVTKDRFAVIVKDCDHDRFDLGSEILKSCGAEKVLERV